MKIEIIPIYSNISLGFIPSFQLIEERSSQDQPLVQVSFVDGSSDFLLLRKYENLDGHFIGHLENEPTACVAMVRHPEHVELTILSDRIVDSSMYKWHNDGLVELIPEVFSRGQLDRDDHNSHDYNIDPKLESKLHEIEEKMTTAEAATVPKTAKLQLKVREFLNRAIP